MYRKIQNFPVHSLLPIPPLCRGITLSTSSVVIEKRSTASVLLWVDILTNEMICMRYEKNLLCFSSAT